MDPCLPPGTLQMPPPCSAAAAPVPRTVQEPSRDPAGTHCSRGMRLPTSISRGNPVPWQHLHNTANPCSKCWRLSISSLQMVSEEAFSSGYPWVYKAPYKSLLTLQTPAACFAKQQQQAQRFQNITRIFRTQPTSAAAFGAPGSYNCQTPAPAPR